MHLIPVVALNKGWIPDTQSFVVSYPPIAFPLVVKCTTAEYNVLLLLLLHNFIPDLRNHSHSNYAIMPLDVGTILHNQAMLFLLGVFLSPSVMYPVRT